MNSSYADISLKDHKYKIAFLMNGAKPPRGGEFLLFQLIVNLNKERDQFAPIVLFAEEGRIIKEIKDAGIDTIHIPLSINLTSKFPQEILYNPIRLIGFLWDLFRSMYVFKVIKTLKKQNVDLIYCADTLSKFVGGISGKWLNLKTVAHCHADYSSGMFQNMTGRFLKIIDLFFLDVIIAVSEKVRNCFKTTMAASIITIYNGVETKIYDPDRVDAGLKEELGIKDNCLIIGSIGALEENKGQKYLLEAIAKLKADGIADILCLVCGAGPEEENLNKLVKEEELTEEVLFLGFREDLPRIFKVLDLMVITSFYEACPMVAIEAMAMKVPVIASSVGGVPELVDDGRTGILVPPGNVEVLCDSIKRLINDSDSRKKMGDNGRKRVLERFTSEQNVRKTEELFLDVLRGS